MAVKRLDLEYSFSWVGDCTSIDGCDVTIVNRFNNPWATGGSVERLTLEAYAKVTESSANPFAVARSLEVEYLHLTMFAAKGNDKVVAVCKLTPGDDPVIFVTAPVD